MTNAVSEGTGDDHNREGRRDYTDKPDPIRESACIWCMACVTVCPTTSIKVDEANLQVHEEESQKFVENQWFNSVCGHTPITDNSEDIKVEQMSN